MGLAIVGHSPGPVKREHHGQALKGHVMDKLIDGALHERAVYGDDGLHAADREPGREGDRVLLGNADVEETLRIAVLKLREAGPPSTWPP